MIRVFAGDDQLRPFSLQTKAEGCLTHFCGCLADPDCEGGELPPRGGRTERGGPLTARGRAVPGCGTPTGERGCRSASAIGVVCVAFASLSHRSRVSLVPSPPRGPQPPRGLRRAARRSPAGAGPRGAAETRAVRLSRAALQSAPLLGAGRGRLSRSNAPGAACAFQRCYRTALLPHRAA